MTFKTSRTRSIRAGLGTTATSLAVLILATSGAFAQEGSVETITVTGFRASLENTIALKKESTQIVEAVSAEDIGKLPDQSIAEAIARLPGLTAQRTNGRAQDISIRGLAPDFSTTLLNGREQVSTSNNRSAQYDQYPAELMSGVVVFKTPTADLVGQGLSGTVDMRTIRPLDYDHTVFAVNARGETGSMGKLLPAANKYGYRVNGTYIDQYAGGKLGLTLGVAVMDSPQQFIEYQSWGYTSGNGGTVPSSDTLSGGAKWQANTDDLQRKSALATLQYRPNENFESTFDVFLTQYKDAQQFVRDESPLYGWGGDGAGNTIDLKSGFTVKDGFVTSGTYTTSANTGVKAVLRQEMDRHNNNLFAIGWKNVYTDGAWTFTADLSHSNVQRKDQWFEAYAGTGRAGTGATDQMSFVVGANNVEYVKPTLDYGDFNTMLLTSPQGWGNPTGGQDGYLNYQHVRDHLTSVKLAADWDAKWGPISKLSFGLNYANRHKKMTPEEYFIVTTANNTAAAHNVSTVIPEKYRFGDAHGLKYFGIPSIISWDAESMLDDGLYTKLPWTHADVAVKGWQVDEMGYTAYVRADIDTEVASIPVVGNAGIQFVETHQSSDGFAANADVVGQSQSLHDQTNYGEVLPSINLTAKLNDSNQIRLGLARELVRARMDQLSVSNEFSFNQTNNLYYSLNPGVALDVTNKGIWGGSVGNARLKPWLAEALDISYEYYFGRAGYVSIAGFHKMLESYIYQKSELYDFTGFDYTGTVAPVYRSGLVTQYVNGKGGRISGFEVSFAVTGDMLTDYLEGFGITGNASYTDSSIKRDPSDPKGPLEGLSKLVNNVTLYYERGGFSIRLNDSYRSKFLGEVTGFGATRELTMIRPQSWLDGQIGYEFKDGSMQGLSVLFQVNNILNQTQISYLRVDTDLNDARKVHDYQKYGTTFLFGVAYKMN
jgi:iron complex outermembrane recepter protein